MIDRWWISIDIRIHSFYRKFILIAASFASSICGVGEDHYNRISDNHNLSFAEKFHRGESQNISD